MPALAQPEPDSEAAGAEPSTENSDAETVKRARRDIDASVRE
jgi:hypothetical protein